MPSLALEEPRQPSLLPRPRHDSPHVLRPEHRLRTGGSSHVEPAVTDYVQGGPPLQGRGVGGSASASALGRAERERRAVHEPRSLAGAHTLPVPSGRGSSGPGLFPAVLVFSASAAQNGEKAGPRTV